MNMKDVLLLRKFLASMVENQARKKTTKAIFRFYREFYTFRLLMHQPCRKV